MDTENRTSRKRNAFATALLTTLAFALGFAEFVLIGITPDVAEGLGEPLTLIGDLVGYYALACAVATPIVALATARADRFKVMAALLVVFNAGNLLTLFADGYALLLVSRVLPAVTSGTLLALALKMAPTELALDGHFGALAEVTRKTFGARAEHRAVDEVRIILPLARLLVLAAVVDRHAEAQHGKPTRGGAKLGIARKVAADDNSVNAHGLLLSDLAVLRDARSVLIDAEVPPSIRE